MLNVYLCITQDHNLLVLLLAAGVCILSAAAGLFMLDRARHRAGVSSFAWLLAAGAVFGGGAVWTTHFVAMLGYDVGVPIAFRAAPTFASALIGMFGAAGAFLLVRRSGGQLWRVGAAGVILGLSIVGMHYLGMQGVLVPGTFTWAPSYVAASILCSVGFSLLCVLLYTQMEGDSLRATLRRVGAATGVAVLAICSLHFTAMTGLGVMPDGSQTSQLGGLSRSTMAGLIVSRAMLLVVLGLGAAGLDAILSERRRAEEMRLRALVDQLRESERRLHHANQAKSQFLSRMSHEFRTPLNGIVGLAAVLKRDATAQQAAMLDMIAGCGKSLGAMVDDILDLARFEDEDFTFKAETFALEQLMGPVEAEFAQAAESKGLILRTSLQHGAPDLVGDRERIAQILSVMVDNAIKFTEQGEVRVGARTADIDAARTALELTVEDTGVGVPEDASSLIFEAFKQADNEITRRHEGAGLGLALARRLCEAMGGALTLERLPDGGSLFRATLVLEPAAPELFAAAAMGRRQAA